MRTVWLAVLLVFCVVASGLILNGGGQDPSGTGFAAKLADQAQAAVQSATARLGADEPAEETAADPGAERPPTTFYRYTDETGTVRFVTSLEQVPRSLRASARPVGNDRIQRAPALPPPARKHKARTTLALDESSHEVLVYTAPWCGWCRKTLAYLTQQGVAFENRDIEADASYREELLEKTGGTSIPVVEIDGELIRGYDPQRMAQLLRSS
jgi:glutaredoxin-like YruB-family protein